MNVHHPGPPRFCSVGDYVELAPRDPDPDATYSWRVERSPSDSTASIGDGPVEYLQVDAAGTFVVELTAPEGAYTQTIRVFEGRPRDEGASAADGTDAAADETDAAADEGDAAADETEADTDETDRAEYPQTVGPPSGVSGVSGAAASYAANSGGDVLTGRREDDDAAAGASGGLGETLSEERSADGRPRIQLTGRVADDGDILVEADPRPNPASDETPSDLDVEFALDDRDPITAADVSIEGATLRIPADAVPERARIHAVAVGELGHSVADVVDVRRRDDGSVGATDSGVDVRRPYDPPSWADDTVIYEIYVRTFAEDVEAETRFDAITEKFDHLEQLGVDVLWLTPVLQNDHAPHGYNITDFRSIAEDLGDSEDYQRFVEAAHDRGFAVLFDLVCNHSARSHPFFQDAYGNPDSEYYDWYEWQDGGEPGTYFDWEHIANFDFSHLPVRRHMLDAIDQWAPLVDGFRVDMAWAVPNGFWRELHDRVKARDEEFLLLDETIPYIPDFQEGLFDVHFDSTTYAMLRSVGTGWEPAEHVLDAVEQRTVVGFPDHAGFMLYMENHDETRYRVECGRDASLAAAGALCTLPGRPLIYAGQELGQLGKRDEVVWDSTDDALLEHYRRLTAARHSIPALSAGATLDRIDYDVREGDADAVVAFERRVTTDTADAERSDAASADGDDSTTASRPRVPADTTPTEIGVDDPDAVDEAVVVLNFAEEPAVVDVGPTVRSTDVVSGAPLSAADGLRVDAVAVLPLASAD